MRILRTLVIAALALVIASPAQAADKAKKKKKSSGALSGIVLDVKKDADKDSGTITIMTFATSSKKVAGVEPGTQRVLKFSETTKFERIAGKKKASSSEAAKVADVVKGGTVTITADGDTASAVKIKAAQKKKKNK
jgi:hypothetical protein